MGGVLKEEAIVGAWLEPHPHEFAVRALNGMRHAKLLPSVGHIPAE